MIVSNPYNAESLFTALHKARDGTRYPEPYARVLRISEYIITQVNTDVMTWGVYSNVYAMLAKAWSRIGDEMCMQEEFDL